MAENYQSTENTANPQLQIIESRLKNCVKSLKYIKLTHYQRENLNFHKNMFLSSEKPAIVLIENPATELW